ncbi:UNVERIFIED_CONTAM: PfkB family carbohydrate kinase [Microbacterium sp. SLM126]
MILTVTPNPAIDITWHVDRLTPGATHRAPRGVSRAGGKGLNVARVLHQMGHDVVALTTVGGTTGREFRSDLERSGIPHRLIPTTASTRISAAIVDDEAGGTSMINEIGDPLTNEESGGLADAANELAASADAVAISGSLRAGFDTGELSALVERVTRHAPTVVDTSGSGIVAAAQAGAHVLKPNREELAAVTGYADPHRGAWELVALGARLVVASLGSDGLLVVAAAGPAVTARLAAPLRGNATGAGDAAVAAISVALASRHDLWSDRPSAHDARVALARRAAAWSAAAVLMPLAGEVSGSRATVESDILIGLKETR